MLVVRPVDSSPRPSCYVVMCQLEHTSSESVNSLSGPYSRLQTIEISNKTVIDEMAVLHVSNSGNDFRGEGIVSICINTITLFLIVEAPWSSLLY